MRKPAWSITVLVCAAAAIFACPAFADSWPSYRHGVTRNPVTEEQLPHELSLHWVHTPAYKPDPAWPASEGYSALEFDYAFHVTSADGLAFFGSSGDNRVYALNVRTGKVAWSFQTGGPVRFAPELSRSRVFAVSDDGYLYCLAARTGKLLWKFSPAPRDERVIGNGRMISRWPMRAGVMIDGDTVYCIGGMWPAEGVYICALDAVTGKEILRNETAGYLYSDKPHLAAGFGGVAPQGYMAASDSKFFVATGRSLPVAFDKKTGKRLYWKQTSNEKRGGITIVTAGDFFFNVGADRTRRTVTIFNQTDGEYVHAAGSRDFFATDSAYYLFSGYLSAYDRAAVDYLLKTTHMHKRHQRYLRFNECRTWYLNTQIPEAECFLKAGNTFYVAGRGKVAAVREPQLWVGSLEEPSIRPINYRGNIRKGSVKIEKAKAGLALELHSETVEWKNPAHGPSWELFFDFRPFRPAPSPEYGRGAFSLTIKPKTKNAKASWRKGVGPVHPDITIESAGAGKGTVTKALIPWNELKKIMRSPVEEFRFGVRLNSAHDGLPVKAPLWVREFSEVCTFGLERFTLKKGAKSTPAELTRAKKTWTADIKGKAMSIAAADGRLFVSTDEGSIYCFGKKRSTQPNIVAETFTDAPFAKNATYKNLARRIADGTKVMKGWCLILSAGDGALAYELAKITDLKIVCVEPNKRKAQKAREAIHKTGLYGNRIVVDCVPAAKLAYPNYFANLVIVADGGPGSGQNRDFAELIRVTRPYGGKCIFLKASDFNSVSAQLKGNIKALDANEFFPGFERGELKGADHWTHQNGTAAQNNSTNDKLVKMPLEMLWFGAPGPGRMIDRHKAPNQQVSSHGRLYIAGKDSITCVDSYNGTELWVTKEAGGGREHAARNGHVMVADENTVWVAQDKVCFEIDGRTGAIRKKHLLPTKDKNGLWGYIGSVGNILFGTDVESRKKVFEGRNLFALDKKTSRLLWNYKPEGAVCFWQLVANDGKIFFIDGTPYSMRKIIQRRGGNQSELQYTLIALDIKTGNVLWKNPKAGYGGNYGVSDGIIVKNRSYPTGGNLTGFSAKTGKILWRAKGVYDFGPRLTSVGAPAIITNGKIFMWGMHFDLKTGKQLMRTHPISLQREPWDFRWHSGCGGMNASASMLFSRSSALGMYDFIEDSGVSNYAGSKPGCTNSFYPSGGLLLCPETSSGCICTYSFQTSFALKPARGKREYWSYYSGLSKGNIIRSMAVNVGAPGHRRDGKGTLWFSFPGPNFINRIHQSVGLENLYHDAYNRHFKRYEEFLKYFAQTVGFLKYWPTYPGTWEKYYHRNSESLEIMNTDTPWIYTSGSNGIRQIHFWRVAGSYKLRLHFAEILGAVPGQRVFDVKAGGKVVLKDIDVVADAGGPNRALIREVGGIKAAGGRLTVEFAAKEKTVSKDNCPILSGIELIQEKK